MKPTIWIVVGALWLVGCANDAAERAPQPGKAAIDADAVALNGERHYREFCAGCHDTGMLGAPVAGNREDWADRSQLWDAVLFDHAIVGYLEMPAKGGHMDLPDDAVIAAAEHMLRMTFPERPLDCNPPVCSDIKN